MARERFDRQWFLARLAEHKWSQREFAKQLAVDPAGISLLLNGKRPLQLDEARLMADKLGVPLPVLLQRGGISVEDQHRTVKIRGYVSGDGIVSQLAKGSWDDTEGPRDLPTSAFALQARTHFTKLEALDRWLVFISGVELEARNLIGQLSLCTLADGKECVGHIRPGYKSGTFNVHLDALVRENVSLLCAQRVLWIKPFSLEEAV